MTYDYDIALLELTEPLEFTNLIHPVCLPASSHVFSAGTPCWVTGWGTIREGGGFFLEILTKLCQTHLNIQNSIPGLQHQCNLHRAQVCNGMGVTALIYAKTKFCVFMIGQLLIFVFLCGFVTNVLQ